jgi:hypothetical protein
MKTTIAFLLLLVFAGISVGQPAPVNISDPVKYNDFIVGEQNEIGESLLDLMEVINDETSTLDIAMTYLGTLSATIDQSIADMENLEKMNNDYGLKKSAMDLFGFYKRIMGDKYSEIIKQLYSESPDIVLIDQITKEVADEEKGFDAAFQLAQQSFATGYGFTLAPNSMQDDIDGSGQ